MSILKASTPTHCLTWNIDTNTLSHLEHLHQHTVSPGTPTNCLTWNIYSNTLSHLEHLHQHIVLPGTSASKHSHLEHLHQHIVLPGTSAPTHCLTWNSYTSTLSHLEHQHTVSPGILQSEPRPHASASEKPGTTMPGTACR